MDPAVGTASKVNDLIRRLDEAVEAPDTPAVCENVKNILCDVCTGESDFLDGKYLVPHPGEIYSRRLLHADPRDRYTIVVMVWGLGQTTSIHDHAGIWCVECVYRGRIKVTSYDIKRIPDSDRWNVVVEDDVDAGIGEAGALIPPFEFHKIQNPFDEVAVTIHVYGGHLTWCHKFLPGGDGVYLRHRHEFELDG